MNESSPLARGLLRSTALVTLATILTKLMGFVREMTLAYTYGAGPVSDAFSIAFALPGIVLSIVGSSASASFMPVYYRIEDDKKQRFTSNVLNCLAIIGLLFTVVFSLFPQVLVYMFASQLDPEEFALATRFLRVILLASAPLLVLDIFRAYLQIHNSFFFASVIGVVSNLTIIPLIPLSKNNLDLMSIGVAVGYFLCFFALFIRCRRKGFQYSLYVNPSDPGVRHLVRALMPVFIAVGIAELNQAVDKNFASSLPSGAIACLTYAARLSSLITMMIGATLVTVLFPKMSERAGSGDTDSARRYLSESIRRLLPILLPLTVGAFLLAEPIIRILFQRGEFYAEDTRRTAEILQMYSLAFVLNSVNPLLIRAFYAMSDTKTPALCSVGSVGANILLNFLLIGPLQHRGLALATSAAALISCLLLNFTMKRKVGSLGLFRDIPELSKTVAAAALMGGTVWLGLRFVPVMEASGTIQSAAYTAVLVLLGVGVYAISHVAMRTKFYGDVIGILKGFQKKA